MQLSIRISLVANAILICGCFSEPPGSRGGTTSAHGTVADFTSVAPSSTGQLSPRIAERNVLKLPSGNEVRILDVRKLTFSNSAPAVMIKYQTKLKIDDLRALRKEAEEVWPNFKAEAEKHGLKNAVLSANESPKEVLGAIVTGNQGYNFPFTRFDDGTWVLKEY